MAAVAIAGCDVVVTIAKVIKNAADIQPAANAIATPLGIESLLACCTPFRRKRLDQYNVSTRSRIANTLVVTRYRPPNAAICTRRSAPDQHGVGKKADLGAGLNRRHVLGEFQQPVGFGQRRQNPGAVLWMFDGFNFAIGGASERHAHIFAAVFLFLVGEGRPYRQRHKFVGPRAGKAAVSTRIRLATTQMVVVIAEMSDETLWTDRAECIVTAAACVEATL